MTIKTRLNTSRPESVFDKNLEQELLKYTQDLADIINRGLCFPQMTTAQRDAITSPTTGSCVYNTTTNKLNFYNGSAWEILTSAV